MCYFAQTIFACGDWRWGNMMERCPRQHRIGETCGAKLVHSDHIDPSPELCKICGEIAVKQRKLQKTNENIARWAPQGSQFAALLEKAKIEQAQTKAKIDELNMRRPSVVYKHDRLGSSSSPLSSQNGSSYTYSTTSRRTPATGPLGGGYQTANTQTTRAAISQRPSAPDARQSAYYSPYTM